MATQGDDPQGFQMAARAGGRIGSCFIPGLSGQKYQDGEIRGLSRDKNGAVGYQGFIKVAVLDDVKLLFLNGFYQRR
ncbi:hypothetical protein JFQ87_001237 [Aeromonas veronii]|nr:hypothetical protein [Aeromonas veronii]